MNYYASSIETAIAENISNVLLAIIIIVITIAVTISKIVEEKTCRQTGCRCNKEETIKREDTDEF